MFIAKKFKILFLFVVFLSFIDVYAEDNVLDKNINQKYVYNLTGCLLKDLDQDEGKCNKEMILDIDFSVKKIAEIPLFREIEGRISIDNQGRSEFRGYWIFDREGVAEFFVLYGVNDSKSILNFVTTNEHKFFQEMKIEDVDGILSVYRDLGVLSESKQ